MFGLGETLIEEKEKLPFDAETVREKRYPPVGHTDFWINPLVFFDKFDHPT